MLNFRLMFDVLVTLVMYHGLFYKDFDSMQKFIIVFIILIGAIIETILENYDKAHKDKKCDDMDKKEKQWNQ